jgi:hypothetical protein
VLVDVDDTIIEVHGYAKQGAGFGYTGVHGLNAFFGHGDDGGHGAGGGGPTVAEGLMRVTGAKRLVTDALKTVRGLSNAKPLVRAGSAFY